MYFNTELLTDLTVLSALTAFATAFTQLIQHNIVHNRKMWLPLITVGVGSIAGLIVISIPPDGLPFLAMLSSLITGTGGIGLTYEVAKRVSPTTEVVEPPIDYREPNG